MAIVLSILDERPAPGPNEQPVLYLTLSYRDPSPHSDESGFRMVAKTAQNRVIGRWVSDCPLSTVKSCLLWITSNPPQTTAWQLFETEDSLGFENVMNEVPYPTSQYAAPPRDLAMVLAKNLPGSQPQARIAPTPPMPDPQLSAPGAQPTLPQQNFSPQPPPPRPQPLAQVARAPQPPPQLPEQSQSPEPIERAPSRQGSTGGDEREVAIFLRNAMRELKAGAGADHIREALFAFSAPEDVYYDDEEEDDIWLEDGADADGDEYLGDEYEDEEYEDQEEEYYSEDAEIAASLGPLPEGLRPLAPGEVPPNLSDEQRASYEAMLGDDEGIREKLRNTHNRSRNALAHAERIAALREQERQAIAAKMEEERGAQDVDIDPADYEESDDLLDEIVAAPARPENGGGAPIDVTKVAPAVAASSKPKGKRKRKQA